MLNSLMSDPGLVLLILFIFMLVCRVPIAISLGLSAAIVSWLFDMGIDMLPYNFFAGVAKVPLLAIPFFILAGFPYGKAPASPCAYCAVLSENLVGDMTGGLAIATVAVATFWGAVSGSGPATVAALGLILIPAMVKKRATTKPLPQPTFRDFGPSHRDSAEYRFHCLRRHCGYFRSGIVRRWYCPRTAGCRFLNVNRIPHLKEKRLSRTAPSGIDLARI